MNGSVRLRRRIPGLVMSEMPAIVKSTLEDVADPSVIADAEARVLAGSHYWAEDPEVAGVWGLIRSGTDKQADLVVYTVDGDFETAADFG